MNIPELRAAVARKNLTNRELARQMGISENALYQKINGIREFKNSEIKYLAGTLSLSMAEVNTIFFDDNVN